MNQLDKFLELVKTRVGCGYAYGAQGEILTRERLNQLVAKYGKDHYFGPDKDAGKWIGKQCFDCSGLKIWALQQVGILKPSEDYTAHDIFYKLCVPVSKEKLQPGNFCFVNDKTKKRIVHSAVYIGDNQVVHARGTVYGVVQTAVLPYFGLFGKVEALYVDELKKALEFISAKSGIDAEHWYQQAKQVKWLDECFIKIARGFGGL